MAEFSFHLRPASVDDAPFLALALAEALGDDIMERRDNGTLSEHDRAKLQQMAENSRRDDTLYSWRKAIVAEHDGMPIAASISYPGEGYHECRKRTFQHLHNLITFDLEQMQDETGEGEHYLDTLAVLPAYRGKGVARALLKDWIERAQSLHLVPTLACDPENTRAKRLYESEGLREDGHLFIFGEDYLKMTKLANK